MLIRISKAVLLDINFGQLFFLCIGECCVIFNHCWNCCNDLLALGGAFLLNHTFQIIHILCIDLCEIVFSQCECVQFEMGFGQQTQT